MASGVLTFMKPDAVAEQHLGVGRQFARIRVRARQVMDLDLHRAGHNQLRAATAAVTDDRAGVDSIAPVALVVTTKVLMGVSDFRNPRSR